MNWKRVGLTAALALGGYWLGARLLGAPGAVAGVAAGVVLAEQLSGDSP